MSRVTTTPSMHGSVHRESSLTGVGHLSRHILRRDRVRMIVWLLSMTAFAMYFMMALTTIFDEAALAARAAVMQTPSGIVMGGPGYGVDDYTGPVAMANEGITWIVLALAIMSILHVARHTRAEEEDGSAELVRASAVGRHATAVATMLTLILHLLAIAVAITAGIVIAAPETSMLDAGAMALGSALSALVFGAVALVACQISEHARSAIGLSLALFAAAFVVRAAGDIQQQGGSTLSWFSPIAWAQQMRAFVDLRWWPVLLSIALTIVLLALAAVLSHRRDFGAGLIAGRPGPAAARPSLRSPFALAWVQQRGTLAWSTLGLGLLWFGTGTLMNALNDMVADLVGTNPLLGQLFGTDPSQFATSFMGVMILFVAACAAAYAIVMGQRPKVEEMAGRSDAVLAAPLSRFRWFGAQLTVAAIGTVVLLAVSIYALWVGSVLVGVDDPDLGSYTKVLVSYAPAVLIFLTLTAALFGWTPKATGGSWILLAFVFVAQMFGEIFDLPEWVQRLSPFYWVPEAFGDEFRWTDVLGLAGMAAVLAVLAFVGFRRRDISNG